MSLGPHRGAAQGGAAPSCARQGQRRAAACRADAGCPPAAPQPDPEPLCNEIARLKRVVRQRDAALRSRRARIRMLEQELEAVLPPAELRRVLFSEEQHEALAEFRDGLSGRILRFAATDGEGLSCSDGNGVPCFAGSTGVLVFRPPSALELTEVGFVCSLPQGTAERLAAFAALRRAAVQGAAEHNLPPSCPAAGDAVEQDSQGTIAALRARVAELEAAAAAEREQRNWEVEVAALRARCAEAEEERARLAGELRAVSAECAAQRRELAQLRPPEGSPQRDALDRERAMRKRDAELHEERLRAVQLAHQAREVLLEADARRLREERARLLHRPHAEGEGSGRRRRAGRSASPPQPAAGAAAGAGADADPAPPPPAKPDDPQVPRHADVRQESPAVAEGAAPPAERQGGEQAGAVGAGARTPGETAAAPSAELAAFLAATDDWAVPKDPEPAQEAPPTAPPSPPPDDPVQPPPTPPSEPPVQATPAEAAAAAVAAAAAAEGTLVPPPAPACEREQREAAAVETLLQLSAPPPQQSAPQEPPLPFGDAQLRRSSQPRRSPATAALARPEQTAQGHTRRGELRDLGALMSTAEAALKRLDSGAVRSGGPCVY
eukprot:TRINITY_DN38586_c0_g1_i1.p1 TRINITY_DN38586_c0_g1~~TRINITY_DN38586_c0_g1_i1.p1  ORF type:complete len:610 (+),score=130.73 TRINITY_DN38586_c0_g1_i1:70-1899(+)